MKVFVLLFLFLAIFRNCSQNEINRSEKVEKHSLTLSDSIVKNLVYSGEKSLIEDFYTEDLENAFLRYVTYLHIDSNIQKVQHSQLCAFDLNTAEKWSDLSHQKIPIKTFIVDKTENDRYFQFVRKAKESEHVFYSRIHNCHYLKQVNYSDDSIIAFTHLKFSEPKEFKELIEYIWFIHNYNIEGTTSIHSVITKKSDQLNYILYETETIYGDWDMCDQIIVYRTIFSLDNSSGKISKNREKTKSITGKCN